MNRYSQSDWNVVRDLDKLRELTQCPGGTPSRWVRQMAAEIIRLSKERDDWRELQHSAAQCLANRIKESEARGREIERLRQVILDARRNGSVPEAYWLQEPTDATK